MDIQSLCRDFCAENNISVHLSQDMPRGYETAYGTYDVTAATLFLNLALLQDAPEYEVLFYVFHELRHAVQYLHPERFEETLQKSLPYVILYNGICFRLVNNTWRECHLPGDETYFTSAYLSLPYELDANCFAFQAVKQVLGNSPELEKLYSFWLPETQFPCGEHQVLFDKIDRHLGLI